MVAIGVLIAVPGVFLATTRGLNKQVNIRFNLSGNDQVSIRIYNPLGQEVYRILNHTLPAGEHERTVQVSEFSPGVYFIRMETAGKTWSRKFQVSR